MSTPTQAPPQDSKLVRISKILRLAERASTQAEAETYMEKAAALAAEHRIDLDVARAFTVTSESRVHEEPIVKTIPIGKKRSRGLSTYVNLICGIGETNNVRFNIAHNSTFVIAFGFPSDIEMTERIYEAVLPQMVRDWMTYRDDPNRVPEYNYDFRHNFEPRPVSTISLRLNFQDGYAVAIAAKLRRAAQKAQDHVINHSADSTSTALAVRDSHEAVEKFYTNKSRARGAYRGGANRQYSDGARAAGHDAGTKARIGNERAISTTGYSKGAI